MANEQVVPEEFLMEAPERKQFEVCTVIFIRHRGSHDEIGQVYRELYEWARRHDVEVAGQGLTIFLSPPDTSTESPGVFEVCIPVSSAPVPDERVAVKQLPACTVASVTVRGPYSEIPARYAEMLAWLSVEGWGSAGPPREVYIRRPDAQGRGDPKEFVTEIQFPLED